MERKKKREKKKGKEEGNPAHPSNTAQPAQPFHAGPALLFPFPGPTQRAACFPPHGPLLSPPFFLSPLRIPGRARPKRRNAPRSAQQRPGLLLPRGPSRCSTADRASPAGPTGQTRLLRRDDRSRPSSPLRSARTLAAPWPRSTPRSCLDPLASPRAPPPSISTPPEVGSRRDPFSPRCTSPPRSPRYASRARTPRSSGPLL